MKKVEKYTEKSRLAIILREDHMWGPMQQGLKEAADLLKGKIFHLYSRALIQELKEYQPREIIVFHNKPLDFKKLRELEGTEIGWWMCDLRKPEQLLNTELDFLKAIFLCNKEYIPDYEEYYQIPTYYMPQASVLAKKIPTSEEKINWDIIFVGRLNHPIYHQERNITIDGLRKKGFKVEVRCNPSYGGEEEERIEKQTKWLYKYSPFCLVQSINIKGYNSVRLYNVLAYQGFALVKYFRGIEDLFENHKHLCWFKTIEEAEGIINYYYKYPKKYQKIKEEGHKLYLEKHTCLHRVLNMLDILKKNAKKSL
ncbi:MAG: glycosyltransferase [bacterium]